MLAYIRILLSAIMSHCLGSVRNDSIELFTILTYRQQRCCIRVSSRVPFSKDVVMDSLRALPSATMLYRVSSSPSVSKDVDSGSLRALPSSSVLYRVSSSPSVSNGCHIGNIHLVKMTPSQATSESCQQE